MMIPFKKIGLAAAVGGLMASGTVHAGTVGYSMYQSWNQNLRLNDLPVNDSTALFSSNPAHSNYLAPNDWRDATGAVVTSPNYGWAQGSGLPATWHASLGANDTASVNSADRIAARQAGGFIGGVGADPADFAGDEPTALTAGSGAYKDTATNWGHNADFGLFSLTAPGDVTITVSGTLAANLLGNGQSGLRPGFSVWQGWDDLGGTRHTTWDENGAPGLNAGAPAPFNPGAPSMGLFGASRPVDGLGAFMGTAWTTTNNGTATLTLTNLAAGDYTMVIGGYTNTNAALGPIATGNAGTTKQYSVSFSTTAVPIPGAVWLFGSALAGLAGAQRRRRVTPA